MPGDFFQFAPNVESHTSGTKCLFTTKEKHMELPSTPHPPPSPSCSAELRPVMQMRNRCVGGWRARSRPCFHNDPRLTRSRKSCLPSFSRSKTWIPFGSATLHESPAWEREGRREQKKKKAERESEGGRAGVGNPDRRGKYGQMCVGSQIEKSVSA